MRALIFALVLTAAPLAGPMAASAADANCLWDTVDEEQRQAWLEAYVADPASAVSIALPARRAAALAAACQVPADQQTMIGDILSARILETGSGEYWAEARGDSVAIEMAWMDLAEDDQVALRLWAGGAIARGLDASGAPEALGRLALAVGVADPKAPEMVQVTAFALGRGYREQLAD